MSGEHKHHILSVKLGAKIWIALLVMTVVTVAAARVDMGALNFPIAMLIATAKALLVVLWFMGLKYDSNENRTIFGTSFVFVAIFVVLTATDLLFRGEYKVKGPLLSPVAQSGEIRFKKGWNNSPELLAHGKVVYANNCASCHGDQGQGNGPAGLSLNPHPRNFTSDANWKNGRKPTQVFATLEKGIPGSPMAAYKHLSLDDRWGLVHYVLSLGPSPERDAASDYAAIGIDINKDDGGLGAPGSSSKSIPIEAAIDFIAE